MDQVKRLGVCGSGIMGHGIAQVAAIAGLEVRLMDTEPRALETAQDKIEASLAKLSGKGKLTPAAAARPTTAWQSS